MLPWRHSNSMVASATIRGSKPGNTRPEHMIVSRRATRTIGDAVRKCLMQCRGPFWSATTSGALRPLHPRVTFVTAKVTKTISLLRPLHPALLAKTGYSSATRRTNEKRKERSLFSFVSGSAGASPCTVFLLRCSERAKSPKRLHEPKSKVLWKPVTAAETDEENRQIANRCSSPSQSTDWSASSVRVTGFRGRARGARSAGTARRAKDPGVLSSWFLLLWTSKEEGTGLSGPAPTSTRRVATQDRNTLRGSRAATQLKTNPC